MLRGFDVLGSPLPRTDKSSPDFPIDVDSRESMPRATISAPELFSFLNEEFSRLQPVECHRCVTPPPIRKRPAGSLGANWTLPELRRCSKGCPEILFAIAARLELLYLLDEGMGILAMPEAP